MILSGLRSLRGLVIDDQPFIRQLIRDILNSVGIRQVDVASTGAHGLELQAKTNYQFIFVDWEMSGMSGIEFVKAVRRRENKLNAFAPIIMVTSHSEEERVMEARDAGVHEYLVKPFTARALLRRVQGIVNTPRKFVVSQTYFGPEFRTGDGGQKINAVEIR